MSEFAVTEDRMLQAARKHLRAARWQQAEALARGWLAKHPHSIGATALYGLALLGSGRLEPAREMIETAASIGPDQAFTCLALAQLYLIQNKSTEAEIVLRRALTLNPQETEAAALLASLQAQRGDIGGAERLLRHTLSSAPDDTTTRYALAELLMLQDQNKEAAQLLEYALKIEPAEPTAWFLLARVHTQQAAMTAACDCVERALLLAPENPRYLMEQARIHLLAGLADSAVDSNAQFAVAEAAARHALALLPKAPETLSLLGSVLRVQRRFAEAVSILGDCIRLNPEAAAPVMEMALTQHEAGNQDAACLAAQRAVALASTAPAPWALLVGMTMTAGRASEAYAAQEQADRLLRPAAPRRNAPLEHPKGEPNILSFVAEDLQSAIFFARYLPALDAIGWLARLALPTLGKGLFSRVPNIVKVVDLSTPDDFAEAEPFSRLPVLLGSAGQDMVWNGPYLSPDPQRVAALCRRFSAKPVHRIGINLGQLSDSALAKSIATLVHQTSAEAVLFGSTAQATSHWSGVPHELATVAELDDAAVWIQALDEVITVSSPLAHLCGALGKRCHILLPLGHETLWGAVNTTTPWYPTARLYRKSRETGWDDAMVELAQAVSQSL